MSEPSSRSMELARDALDGGEWLLGETILRVAIALDTIRAEVIAEFAGDLVSQFAAVRAEERERCARIAEYFDQLPPATIASAIRNEKHWRE